MQYSDIAPGQRVVLLESASENGGACSRLQAELSAGARVAAHYHLSFEERFEVVSGELTVWLNGKRIHLTAGHHASVAPHVVHWFANETDTDTTVLITLVPGQPGTEQLLQVMTGLKRDGRLTRRAVPRDPYVVAYIMEVSDTRLAGAAAALTPLLRWLGARAKKKGLYRELVDRYVT